MGNQNKNPTSFLIIFGACFTLGGLLSAMVFGQSSTLSCQRLESTIVDCRLRRDLLGYPLTEIEIGQLQSAWVDVSYDSDGDTYRVVMQGREGVVPLTAYYSSSQRDKQEKADRINSYLLDPAGASLEVRQADWWIFLFAAVFVGIGFLSGGLGLMRGLGSRLSR